MATRPQPHRLTWPLTPTQVEGVDEMLQILFKKVRQLEDQVDALPAPAQLSTAPTGFPGLSTLDVDGVAESVWAFPIPGAVGAAGRDGVAGAPGRDSESEELNWPTFLPRDQPIIQTTTSTGTQNDFVLLGRASELRCNNATLLTLTGLTAGTDGQQLTIVAVGAGQVDIPNLSGSSAAGNKIANGIAGPRSLVGGSGSMTVVYDVATTRWIVLAHSQGAAISVTYAAGNFTASGSMTWTVDAGDQSVFQYHLNGNILTVFFAIVTSSIGGTPANSLLITIPAGHLPAFFSLNAGTYLTSTGVAEVGYTFVIGADSHIYIQRLTNTAYAAVTNTQEVEGTVVFPVS